MSLQLELSFRLAAPACVTVIYNPYDSVGEPDHLRVVAINNGGNYRLTDELLRHADAMKISPSIPEDSQRTIADTWDMLRNYLELDTVQKTMVDLAFRPIFDRLRVGYEDFNGRAHDLVGEVRIYLEGDPIPAWVWKDRVVSVQASIVY